MLIRANSLGVSSCWVDTFENNTLRRHLKIPDEITPEIIITLGYSDEKSLAYLKTDLNKINNNNNAHRADYNDKNGVHMDLLYSNRKRKKAPMELGDLFV